MIASEVMDFPEPDSPTKPSTSPELMEKLKLRTAAIARAEPFGEMPVEAGESLPWAGRRDARALGNSMVRLLTSRSGGTSVWYQRSGNGFHYVERLFIL